MLGLLAFSLWAGRTYVDHSRMLSDVRDKVINFEAKTRELETRAVRAQARIDRYDLRALRVQVDKANEFIDWKAFSWTRLFNLMAEIQPYRVRMTSIRPIFRSGRRGDLQLADDGETVPVAIQGIAEKFEDVSALQDALLADPQIGRVEPDRLYKTEGGEYVFEMIFYYLPADRLQAREVAVAADEPAEDEADGQPALEAIETPAGEAADGPALRPVVRVPTAEPTQPLEDQPDPGQATAADGGRAEPAEKAEAPVTRAPRSKAPRAGGKRPGGAGGRR